MLRSVVVSRFVVGVPRHRRLGTGAYPHPAMLSEHMEEVGTRRIADRVADAVERALRARFAKVA